MQTNKVDNQSPLIQKLQSFNKRLQFLQEISQQISEKKPLPHLLHDIMENSKRLMLAEASSLLLYDEADDKLHFHVVTGDKGDVFKAFSMEIGEGIAGWVAREKQSLLIEDCYKDARFNPDYDKKSGFRTRSMICVPLLRKGQLLGVIQVMNKTDGGIFDDNDLSLLEILASQCAIAIENHQMTEQQIQTEILERELKTAWEIQQNLLPKELPVYPDLDMAAILIPAKQIGGDYYKVYHINENQSLFVMADVCGKSISAALIVSIIDACFNSYLKMNRASFDLMDLVRILNEILLESTTSTKYATCWFGLFHHDTSELISVNAGHNPPYLLPEGQGTCIQLETGGFFLGSIKSPYTSERYVLKTDDILVYFTDGVTEAWNEEEEDYGDDNLMQLISKHRNASAPEILKAIEMDVKRHVGDAPQSDDLACVVIKKR